MKGFIEVETNAGTELINVNHIIRICKSYLILSEIYNRESNSVLTSDNYEELKQKIAEAVK